MPRDRLLLVLCLTSGLQTFSIGAFPALLPEIGRSAGLPYWQLGAVAGAFGFEAAKYGVSMKAAERVLLPLVREAPSDTFVLANGFSCREQIEQATGRHTLHVAELIDSQAKPLVDLDRDSTADLPVVDHEVKFAVGRAIELKDGTRPELHDFAQHHLPFGESHGYRHLKFQDASGAGYRT